MARAAKRLLCGFTLVEAALAIAILGIVAAVVAVYLRSPVEGYFATARRAQLTEAADNAIRRLARDVRAALPNSLRQGPGTQCFEFLAAPGGGRYRWQVDGGGGGDVLDLDSLDGSFDVLASVALPDFSSGTYHAVVYNLGIPGADAYAGDNRTGLAGSSTPTLLNLSPSKKYPFASPGRRVHVIENEAVVYSCAGSTLRRSTRPIAAAPLTSCPGGGEILAANVSACSLDYTNAVNPRFGVLAVTLALSSGGETVTLYHEIHVSNIP